MDQSRQWPNPPPKRQRLQSGPEATYSTPVNDGNWTNQHQNGPDTSVSGLGLSNNTQNYMLDHLQHSFVTFHATNDTSNANRRVLDQGNFPNTGTTAFRPVLPNLKGSVNITNDLVNSNMTYGTSLCFETPLSAFQAGYSYTGQAQYPLEAPQQCHFQPILPAHDIFGYGLGHSPFIFCNEPPGVRHSTAGTPPQVVGAIEEKADESQKAPTSVQHRVETERDNLDSDETVCFGTVWSRSHHFFLVASTWD